MLDASLTKGFIAQGMRVGARFLWQPVKTDGIEVNLFDAHVGTLMDHARILATCEALAPAILSL